MNRALSEGPQVIVRRKDEVILIARRDYDRLAGQRPDFKNFLTGKGSTLEGVDITRDRSPMRDVVL